MPCLIFVIFQFVKSEHLFPPVQRREECRHSQQQSLTAKREIASKWNYRMLSLTAGADSSPQMD